tara:strand:- start:7059 stop:7496 length:438 start_codon:yes stop_codon:yes gene_type:complete
MFGNWAIGAGFVSFVLVSVALVKADPSGFFDLKRDLSDVQNVIIWKDRMAALLAASYVAMGVSGTAPAHLSFLLVCTSLTVLFGALRAQTCSVAFLIAMAAHHAFSYRQHYLAHSVVFCSIAVLFLIAAAVLVKRSMNKDDTKER